MAPLCKVSQNIACNNSTHHPLLAFGWANHSSKWVEYLPSSKGQDLDQMRAVWSAAPILCLCWRTYPRFSVKVSQHKVLHQTRLNSISTIFVSALYKHRGQPHTHTLNTNHGNPSVAQFSCCWEVDQTKAPESSTANWWLHTVTASLNDNDSLNTCNQDTVSQMPCIAECPMLYSCQNCAASGRDKALSHRSVSLWRWSPELFGKWLLK